MENAVTESHLLPADVSAAMSLREMAFSWEGDPLTAEGARRLEFLIGRGVQLAIGLQLAWSLATEDDKVWEGGGYLRRIQAIDFLATVVVDILARTQEILTSERAKHPDWIVPQEAAEVAVRLSGVKQLADRVREILNRLKRPRPPVSEEMLQRSRESLDRGEGQPIDEIIEGLKDSGAPVKE
jgi:hypothetical protein